MSAYFALAWLNFFIADVRDGLGPYLGVFLKGHQFTESQIGLITTSTSLYALIFEIFLGILIDKTHFKRGIIALCIAGIVLATGTNYFIRILLLRLQLKLPLLYVRCVLLLLLVQDLVLYLRFIMELEQFLSSQPLWEYVL